MRIFFLIALLVFESGCRPGSEKTNKPDPKKEVREEKTVSIKLLPLGKINSALISTTFSDLKKIVSDVELLPHEEMPSFAFYAPRNRYRADTLLDWMRERAKEGEVYVGLTMQDISTTKGDNPDHGIMGLGFQPGKACIASSFRLRDKKNFFKVVIHELGHTTGLPHCPETICFMRDAKGGDLTGEEKEFCKKCRVHLKAWGWKL